MKSLFVFLLMLLTSYITAKQAWDQVPQKMSYQAVIRNSSGALVNNSNVGIRIQILQNSEFGAAVYVEIHTATTNANGLATVEIGGGTIVTGTFAGIDWSSGPYFLKTETDPTGGTNYTITGISQILSVPFALHAKTAENGFSGDYNDLENKPDFTGWDDNASDDFNGNYNSLINKPINIDEDKTDDVLLTGNQTIAGNKTFTGTINASNKVITNIATPVNATDAANKAYVDQLLSRIEALEARIGYGTFLDARDNHYYKEILIGNQIWMAENLAYLPSVSPTTLQSYTNPYYYVYGYNGTNVSEAKATSNYQNYGVLYNWPAAMNGAASSNSNPSGVQGACPSGWHLPSDAEWKQLEMFIGMSQSEADAAFWRGTNEGGKLKETGLNHWLSPNTGATNSSGFTALPSGCYNSDGNFSDIGEWAHYWTSTHDINNTNNSIGRELANDEQRVYLNGFQKRVGLSVRCVKD